MKISSIILTLVLLPIFTRASYVTDAVAQMPAKNPAAESALAAKIMSGGVPAVKELTALLIPLGTEGKDDTAARYAVSALVRFAGRPGGENDRAALTKGLCDALASTDNAEIRTFLVNRLQEVGHDDAVPTLTPLLSDEKLALHAAAALERIASPAAIDALKNALPNATGQTRIALVKSLGALRVADAAAEIRKSVTDDDKTLRLTSLWALAQLGDPATFDLIGSALVNTKSPNDRGQLYAATLDLARRLNEAGRKLDAAKPCLQFLNDTSGDTPINVRAAAARLLTEVQGDAAIGVVMPQAEHGDPQLAAAIWDAVARLPGEQPTREFINRLREAAPVEAKVGYLDALAKRKDPASREAITKAASDTDPRIRLAALRALVALGPEQAIPTLVRHTMTDPDVPTSKAAADMLSRIPGDAPLIAATAALEKAPPKAKVILLELLAGRAAKSQRDAVLKQTADTDPSVRLAALRAMEKLATEADAPALLARAAEATDPGEESAALKSAVAAASQSTDTDHRIDPFLAALEKAKTPKRGAIERSLAKLGGPRAFDAVLAGLKSGDAKVKEGSLQALSEWQDPAALAPLLDVAKSDPDPNRHITAIRGVAQVLKSATAMPAADKAAAYAQAMSLAHRPEDKKTLLGVLANERGQAFFDIAAAAQDDPALKAESALAVIKIAVPQPRSQQPGLTGDNVVSALKKAIENCPDANLRGDAQRYLNTLSKK